MSFFSIISLVSGQPYCRSKSDNKDERSRKNREKIDLCKRRGKKTGKCRNVTGRKIERNNGFKIKATKKSRTFSKTEGRRRNARSTKCLETRLSKSSPLWYFGWNVLDAKSPEKRTAAQLVKSQCRFVPSTFPVKNLFFRESSTKKAVCAGAK